MRYNNTFDFTVKVVAIFVRFFLKKQQNVGGEYNRSII